MSLFRRRKTEAAEVSDAEVGAAQELDAELDELDELDEPDEEDTRPGLSPRPDGPWDVVEQPDADGYVDLGALRLRGRAGMELRLEMDESTGTVNSATVQLGESAVQLQAFAAPRSEGIWEEIRGEIASGITRQGGTADEVAGVFGRELLARIPARTPDGRTGHQPARFVGIDGPRWFLRAVFHGQAVHDAGAALDLESVVRDIVVVRGEEAMAPRELLVLSLPEVVTADGQASTEVEPPAARRDDLQPFERGPEITEIH
ncbi:MAG: DUF3710 domain-containing protein [Kineosporiaceae bacterium]|nr:DUF3710 domain-containing protein [Kineosporiaceae bacterium]MBK7625167.1 DUF3710 domain-containing protein [Kineosporiaceae bacterium]MBK8076453.1 DUF3710 domain-containing protein [Kineosporiaceae bacterium]